MSSSPSCPFCNLEALDLILEGERVVVFEDRYPVTPGHLLLITRRHVETWFDATPEEQRELLELLELAKRHLQATRHPDGFNVGFNAGAAAGQTVPHLHVHLIPRYRGDTPDPRGGVRGVVPDQRLYGDLRAPDTASDLDAWDALPTFLPGQEQPLLPALRQALLLAEEVDLLSSFVQPSGLAQLRDDLEDALQRGVRVRILTGDYLNITSPDALRTLLALDQEHEPLSVRFYRTPAHGSFHPKAYLFVKDQTGVAWVGSSNLSATALGSGTEWNLRTLRGGDELATLRRRFVTLFHSEQAVPLSRALIADYETQARVPPAPEPRAPRPTPHAVQREALAALEDARAEGAQRGLVVMATGLGKTYLSAFDFDQTGGQRALFIAHREEILTQARTTWERLFPDKTTGLYTGKHKTPDADIVFASIQALARALDRQEDEVPIFGKHDFDYVVIDEFHHAAASTYREALKHFDRGFLLGLTATPDRMDGASLLEACQGRLVVRAGLVEGITRDLLVPFHYYGLRDTVDYAPIPWRNGRFDEATLTEHLATQKRAEHILAAYQARAPQGPRRTLAFCCSVTHADYMAEFFREHGVPAAAVHSHKTSAPRAESLRQLAQGKLEILCAVDVFNEGLDVPDVNVVLMLRATDSPVIFLQQLGRGLRRPKEITKPHLTVIDLIGNHRSFLRKPQALLALTGQDLPPASAIERIRAGTLDLPPGCHVEIETEALDALAQLATWHKEDMLLHQYAELRDTHGRRPTASELFQSGVTFKPLRERYASWFDFLATQNDLTEAEAQVLERHRDWLQDVERTGMTRSYKMIALQVLLDRDALWTGLPVPELARAAYDQLCADPVLRYELPDDQRAAYDAETFEPAWRKFPLQVWAKGKGTTQPWFDLTPTHFTSRLAPADPDRQPLAEMTRELIDYRLHVRRNQLRSDPRYLAQTKGAIRLKLWHAGKGDNARPILQLNRERYPNLPEIGETRVRVDGEPYLLRFQKIAVNVATEASGGPNQLPRILRGWFGPFAGRPGTLQYALLTQESGTWHLHPDRQLGGESQPRSADPPRTLRFPSLPYYEELRAACGAAKAHPHATTQRHITVQTHQPVDPTRHFVVRAEGDSMSGGENPIHNGDLLLCAWLSATRPEDVEGKPCLLSGYQGENLSFTLLKVPVREGNQWILRSWNPEVSDTVVEPEIRLEPFAVVVQPVTPGGAAP